MMVRRYQRWQRQAGFSLVASIFVLVVLVLLGVFMVTLSAVQHITVAQALEGARAYQAAGAGIEWATARVLSDANRASACGDHVATSTTNSFVVSATGLVEFSVSVTCRYTRHREASSDFCVYEISSTAQKGTFGDSAFVTRQIQAQVTDAPSSNCPV
ncbi:MAG: hypothetical protein HY308_07405 [Gammaproteobacteria bacterium]|nr:hypothetical protein [Gammaproteobacteria bacterium]